MLEWGGREVHCVARRRIADETARTMVLLDVEKKRRLETIAYRYKTSVAALIREAVDDLLDQELMLDRERETQ